MSRVAVLAASHVVLFAATSPAATVLFCPMDSLEGWSIRAVGATEAAIVQKSPDAHCVELNSRQGTLFLTRELPLDAVQGSRLSIGCMVKTEGVVRGAQVSSTAKLHLAVQTPAGIQHQSVRLTGASDWHREGLTVDVPADARRVVLNLGLESCTGKVQFERLLVQNDRRSVYPLDLGPVANASHEQLGLAAFPQGTVEWQGIPLKIMSPAEHDGADCLRLSGEGHLDWPQSTASRIPLGKGSTSIYILHAALGTREKSETPSAIWTAWFAGGQDAGLSVFEGREIGSVGRTEDLENWKVAWRKQDPTGKWTTFGVTKWTVYSDAPVVGLSCRAYRGSPPVILAVTAIEEPPKPRRSGAQEDDEWSINE